ncbi:MAG: acyl carrier protein [Bacteroidia bacterium]
MNTDPNTIRNEVRQFIIEHVYQGNDTSNLTDDTSLIRSRLIDSIVALKLVSHLEEKFGIEFEAHEVDQDNLDTIAIITAFVQQKIR